jgi:hypothetical protein
MKAFEAYICKRKMINMRIFGSFKSAKKIKVRKFVDLRIAELIYGPPTFAKLT